jgi:DNA-directed RNA polymerase specialized sigma24 family protein
VSDILDALGLTAEQVRAALGTPDPKPLKPPRTNYLNAHDQARIHRRLQLYEGFIYAKFIEGYHPGTLARVLNVSEEAVRTRLRRANLFRS